jgi:hypothetical protein
MTSNETLERLQKAREPKPKKVYKGIAKKSARTIVKEKAEKENGKPVSKLESDKWFFDIEEKYFASGFGTCMETGDPIPRIYARAATAHLLPKKIFKSVATHELNYLILSPLNGSHQKTDRVDKFITMKVWPEAARRIKIMIPLLPIDELRHISNQLLIALENT